MSNQTFMLIGIALILAGFIIGVIGFLLNPKSTRVAMILAGLHVSPLIVGSATFIDWFIPGISGILLFSAVSIGGTFLAFVWFVITIMTAKAIKASKYYTTRNPQ